MSKKGSRRRVALFAWTAAMLSTPACAVGPKYIRPEAPSPQAYRETPPPGWTDAAPDGAGVRGRWWQTFNEPALDVLEDQVNISNQNVLAAEAQYRAARAPGHVPAADRVPPG